MRSLLTQSLGCLFVLAFLSGCYFSDEIHRTDDITGADPVREETTVLEDPLVDPGTEDIDEPEEEPPSWRFVDRDVPDREIEPGLTLFLWGDGPRMAWNGSTVGLVYSGTNEAGERAIAFIPIDRRGVPIGEEVTLIEDASIVHTMMSVSDGGDFLVSMRAGELHDEYIQVLRVSPWGEILNSGRSPSEGSPGQNPSAPVQVGDDVYVAAYMTEMFMVDTAIFRFSYPDMSYETMAGLVTPEHRMYDSILTRSPGSSRLMVYYTANFFTHHAREVDLDLAFHGSPWILETDSVTESFTACASDDDWYLWVLEESNLWLMRSSGETSSQTIEDRGEAEDLACAASDYPAHGVTFKRGTGVPFTSDVLWAEMSASPRPGHDITQLVQVSDEDDGCLPMAHGVLQEVSLTWTGDGFLVAWKQCREAERFSFYVSFVELEML